ncbi:MAG: rRNA pseudouridine synthase [Deltaproteobacteria bacterium]|nr:rRNA pseudouridine synthase [Deltaproteobacteria bacterium]
MTAEGVRIQKIMAEAGISSRRGAERLILEGRVSINGVTVTGLGAKAVPGEDTIEVDGRAVGAAEELRYYMFHKPAGFLTALSDVKLGRPTIMSFLRNLPARVYPVGRLDRDVSGILVLTNDGELARRLMHPSYLVPKVYRAAVRGVPGEEAMELLRSGRLMMDGKPCAPAEAKVLTRGEDRGQVELVLTEGRHRQVKRMLSAVGHPVVVLRRRTYSGIPLDPDLPPGGIRPLTDREIQTLKRKVGL